MSYWCSVKPFLYARVRDVLWEHVRRVGGVHRICPLNNFNIFHCIIIKLSENVCWQNISAKFDNQPDPMKHFGVMALELAKIARINLVRSLTSIFFNGSSSNFVTLFVSIISWPSLITSQITWSTLELWPLNYPKLPKLTLSTLIFKYFFQWCIKLNDNVCWHNLSATFNNQPDLIKHFGVMALI